MRRLLLLLCLCTALPTWAAETQFDLGVTTDAFYNSNVQNVNVGSTDSFGIRLGAIMRLKTSANRYEGAIAYSPGVALYFDSTTSDRINHFLVVDGVARATKRLKFSLHDSFRLASDADRDLTEAGVPSVDDGTDKNRITNVLRAGANYSLTPRLSTSLFFNHRLVNFEDKDLSDNQTPGIRWNTNYAITQKSTLGVNFNIRNQFIERSPARIDDLRTGFYGVLASYGYQFTEKFRIDLSGGPTWVVTDRGNNRKDLDTQLKGFGNASLTGAWKRVTASLYYLRDDSTFSSTGVSFISDQVVFHGKWRVSRLWTAAFGATASNRKATQEISISTGIARFRIVDKVRQFTVSFTVERQLRKNLLASFVVDYLQQKRSEYDSNTQTSSFAPSSDQVRASIRFRYNAKTRRY